MCAKTTGNHWLGAPIRQADREALIKAMTERFVRTKLEGVNTVTTVINDPIESAVAYIERMVDRQLNKARGLLTFNSILLSAMNVSNPLALFNCRSTMRSI